MSRRKQQNPKPVLKGDTSFTSPVEEPITETQHNFQEDIEESSYDPGYSNLVINTDDPDKTEGALSSNVLKDQNCDNKTDETSDATSNESIIDTKKFTINSIIDENSHKQNGSSSSCSVNSLKINTPPAFSKVFDQLQQQQFRQQQMLQLQSDDNNSISSDNSQSSSIQTSSSEAVKSNYLTSSMTRMDDMGMNNGEYSMVGEGGNMSPLHGQRPPKQTAPNKTRRKCDKIVPVTDESGSAKYICPVCKEMFCNDSELTRHIRMHNTASAVNTCKICGKVLSSQSSLDRHMLVHSGERPFKCKICKMAFTTNGNMHRHSRIHDKEVGVNASSDKNKHTELSPNRPPRRQQFRQTGFLSNHYPISYRGQAQKRKSSTESENDYFDNPSKRFFFGGDDHALMDRENVELRSSNFDTPAKQNKKNETNNESYEQIQCPICLKPLMSTYGLDTHFKIHTSSDSTLCQLCHTSFKNSREVYVHYLSTHVDFSKIDGEHRFEKTTKSQRKNGLVSSPSSGRGAVGFDGLGELADFSSKQFPHIAKAWCEKNQREPSSQSHSFNCEKCNHAFPCADALLSHLDNHPDECNVSCSVCEVNYVSREQFEDHILQHSKSSVIDNFSNKVGTDDNDVQDMVSQPEFMLVLGLKAKDSRFSSDDCNIMADIKRAIKENTGPVGIQMNHSIQTEIKPMVIQPIEQELEINQPQILQQPSLRMPPLQPLRPANQGLGNINNIHHPAFPPQLKLFTQNQSMIPNTVVNLQNNQKNQIRRPRVNTLNEYNYANNEGHPVEIDDSSSEDEAEIEITAERPWQCSICEFAFPKKPQCFKHFRNHHSLSEVEDLSSAVSYNPFSRLVPNAKPPAWSFKPFLCKLCKNGFSNKINGMKHLIQQHRVEPHSAERHIAANKLLDKTRSYPPGILDTVKIIQAVASQQRVAGGLVPNTMNHVVNNHNLPPAMAGPFSKVNPSTYITSPPNAHPFVKNEPLDRSEMEDQPLDFSMKKNNTESQMKKKLPEGTQDLTVIKSGDEPMDLTVKPPGRDMDLSNDSLQFGTGYYSTLSATHRGVVMSSPSHLNVRDPLLFSSSPQIVPPFACSVNNLSGGRTFSPNQLSPNSSSFGVVNSISSPYSHLLRQQQQLRQQFPNAVIPSATLPRIDQEFMQQQQQQLQQLAVADPEAIFRFYNPVVGKYQCPFCRMFFKHGGQVQNHIQTHHRKGQNSLSCNQCPSQFSTQEALDRHLVSKHPRSEKQLRKPARQNKVDLSANNKHMTTVTPNRRSVSPANRPNVSTLRENNSDSELSSVSSILDATNALNFKAFLSRPNSAAIKNNTTGHDDINEHMTLEIDEDDDESLQGSDKANSPQKEKKVKRNSYSDSPHKLQCPYCPRAFPWISSLKRHILTHTGQKPFKCPECSVTFSTKSNRERHMVRKHGMNIHDPLTRQAMEKPYSCHICAEKYASASDIQKHYKEDHLDSDIPDFINQQSKFESLPAVILQDKLDLSLLETFSTASGDPSEGVDSSLVDFEDEDEDEGSVKSIDSLTTSPFKTMPVSNATSPVPIQIQPITIQPVELNVSTIPDTSKQAVPEYLNKINPERDNYNVDRITRCWKCNANFDSRKVLLRHLKEHNIDNSFKCYLCDASYNGRAECLEHTMKHHPHDWVMLREKNKCYNIGEYSENMEKLVTETIENLGLSELNSAILAGADIDRNGVVKGPDGEEKEGMDKPDSDYAQRKVFCSFCVKRFWSLQDLRRHMRSHTGERPFECDVCQKRFTLKHSMMRHRRKHTPAELAEAASSPSTVLSASDDDTNDDGHSVNPIHSSLRVALFTRRKPDSNRSTPTVLMEAVENDIECLSPVPSTVDETVEDEENLDEDDSDMLHNLLGIDSSKIDELFASKNMINSATEVLGIAGEKGEK